MPKPPASIKGGVAVFRAKDGDWDAHVAMVRQAPRLCLLAQAKGANVRRVRRRAGPRAATGIRPRTPPAEPKL